MMLMLNYQETVVLKLVYEILLFSTFFVDERHSKLVNQNQKFLTNKV